MEYQRQSRDRRGWYYTVNPTQTQVSFPLTPVNSWALNIVFFFSVGFQKSIRMTPVKVSRSRTEWENVYHVEVSRYQVLLANTIQETELIFAFYSTAVLKQ